MRVTAIATLIFAGILAIPAFGAPDSGDRAGAAQSASSASVTPGDESSNLAVDLAAAESAEGYTMQAYYCFIDVENAYQECILMGGSESSCSALYYPAYEGCLELEEEG